MFGLKKQVQTATEIPARSLSRLAGADLPTFDDNESSIAELKARVESARAIVHALSNDAIDASPDEIITLQTPGGDLTLPRGLFLANFIIPNLYFHVSAAYLHLRNMGVDIGKRDFLAAPEE